ncbi:hypothetical protein RSAG8_04213, partial [Rhizoctonia solani AG-8 WAC10335]
MHKCTLRFAFRGIRLGLALMIPEVRGPKTAFMLTYTRPKASQTPVLYLCWLTSMAGGTSLETHAAGRSTTGFKDLQPHLSQLQSTTDFQSSVSSQHPRNQARGYIQAKMTHSTDPELILNAGIHDQRLALKFIQRHIRSFGGDPDNVSIAGQSAGAGAVALHLTARSANPAERLFRRAVVQSWYRPPFLLPAARKEKWETVANSVGCPTNSSTVAHTLECLGKLTPFNLCKPRMMRTGVLGAWLPVIDHTLFRSNPASILNAIPGVDVIVGHTTADSVAGGTFEAAVNATLKAMYVEAGITEENMAKFGLGEAVFRCGTHLLANLYGPRAHTYRWDEPDPANPASAGHSSDNYILYEGSRTLSNGTGEFHALTPAQRGLSDETIAYFTSFYATAEPKAANTSSASHPMWPAHSSGKRIVFRAEGGGTGKIQGTPGASFIEELDQGETERCKVWNSMADRAGM